MNEPLRMITLAILGVLPIPQLAAQDTLKVFLLAGQSNMEGQAYTYDSDQVLNVWNIPSMEFLLSGTAAAVNYRANMPFDFEDSLDASWMLPRAGVWCVHYFSGDGSTKNVQPTASSSSIFNGIGPLSPGFGVGTSNGSMFGAELGMGIRLGDATADPVFVFKSDRGGTTLGNDWRPPTAVAARGGAIGPEYANTMTSFLAFLDDLDADLDDDGMLNAYNNATGYAVSGVFWLQGWNEQYDDGSYTAAQLQAEYKDNLKDLIYSIRAADTEVPSRIPGSLGLIIGESSAQHAGLNASRIAAVAELNAEIPNSAAFFYATDMKGTDWGNNEGGISFSQDFGSHFHARAENYLEIGWKAAGAALDNGFLTPGAFWMGLPVVTGLTPDHVTATAHLNEAADDVIVVWDTSDKGTGDPTDWTHQQSFGTTGAGPVAYTLTGLSEGTDYVVRFFASTISPAAVTWSAPTPFTTPWLNPPPLLGGPETSTITSNSAKVDCQLKQADADVTLVWAFTDQGNTSLAGWTAAPGGGSHSFGSTNAEEFVTHTITGLDAATEYVYRVHASNPYGTAWTAPVDFGTVNAGVGGGADSLVAYWTFDDYNETGDNPIGMPQGNHEGWFEDVTGNGHDAFAADITDGNYVPMAPGKFGNAFHSISPITDSDKGAVAVAADSDLINFSGEDFTISFWEKSQFRDVAGGGWGDGRGRSQWFTKAPYIPPEDPNVTKEGYCLNLTQNNFDFLTNEDNNNCQTSLGVKYTFPAGTTPAYDSGTWAHWAITGQYNVGSHDYTMTIYLNGVAVDWDGATGTTFTVDADIIDNDGDLTIGGFWRNGGGSHQRYASWNMKNAEDDGKAWIDDFAMWEEALGAEDVSSLAAGTSPLNIGVLLLKIAYDGTADNLTFTWNGEAGKTYNLLGNADLSTAPSTWATVLPGVTSPQTISRTAATRYYAVQEAP